MKKRNLLQRFIIIALVTIAGVYVVIGPHRRPKLSDFTSSGIKRSLEENIRLGLDLKGGAHLVMRVKVEDYLQMMAETMPRPHWMRRRPSALKLRKDAGGTCRAAHIASSLLRRTARN